MPKYLPAILSVMSRCVRSGRSQDYGCNFDFKNALLKPANEILVAPGAIENEIQ